MSPTGDYLADTPTLLTKSLGHYAAARVITPAGEAVELELEDLRIGWDETRAPRVEAQLVCRVPTDQSILARLDPRTGARVEVDLGYHRPDATADVHTEANLCLRARPVSRPDNLMELTAQSDESLMIDASPRIGGAYSRTSTVLAITAQLTDVFPGLSPTVTAAAGPAVSQGPYTDRWDLVNDLADQIEAQVYDDGTRQWWIAATPVIGTPALELKVGAGGTIIRSRSGLDRDTWFNQVFALYRWRDTSDVEHTITSVRSVTSGVYAAVVGNTKSLRVEREIATTQAQADAAASAMVKRLVTRGRTFTVTAIAAYWLRPGMTINVTLPLGDTEQHLVQAVEFDPIAGLMDVTTRLPDNTGTIGA